MTEKDKETQACQGCGNLLKKSGLAAHQRYCKLYQALGSNETQNVMIERLWLGFVVIMLLTFYNSVEALVMGTRDVVTVVSQQTTDQMMKTGLLHLTSAAVYSVVQSILPDQVAGRQLAVLKERALCESGWYSDEVCASASLTPVELAWNTTASPVTLSCPEVSGFTFGEAECNAACAEKNLICVVCKGAQEVNKCVGHKLHSDRYFAVLKE